MVINIVLIPKITYRIECVPIVWDGLMEITKMLEDMLLSIVGLPTFLSRELVYSKPKFGIGLLYVPVVVTTGLLDNVPKVLEEYKINDLVSTQLRFLHLLPSAAEALHVETQDSKFPVCDFNDISKVMGTTRFWYREIQNWGLQSKQCHDFCQSAYNDGLYFDTRGKCATAVLLKDQRVLCTRSHGRLMDPGCI